MANRLSAKRQSNHKKRRARRVLTLGTVGALAFGSGVAAMASATGPSTAAAADCSSGIVFTQSDTPAPVGDNPRHVVTGDLDGDGNADVVAADNDADAVSVLLGNGDGTFDDSVAYTTSALPVSLNPADFDGDEVTDVLVSSLNGDSVTVFQGTSGGALTELAELTADGAYEAAAADLTSDGTQDLVVASSADDQVVVFTGSCG